MKTLEQTRQDFENECVTIGFDIERNHDGRYFNSYLQVSWYEIEELHGRFLELQNMILNNQKVKL